MTIFTGVIKRFGELGEKTGWSYIEIPVAIAEQIKPGNKKSFRVKGKLDKYKIEQTSLLPMGGGAFILPINATIRKAIHKNKGASVSLQLTEDNRDLKVAPELLACLQDEPVALQHFQGLAPSHQRYFSKWILSAKTETTKTKRIAQTVDAMVKKLSYSEMIRNSGKMSSRNL